MKLPDSSSATRFTTRQHLQMAAQAEKDSWDERYHLFATTAEALAAMADSLADIARVLKAMRAPSDGAGNRPWPNVPTD